MLSAIGEARKKLMLGMPGSYGGGPYTRDSVILEDSYVLNLPFDTDILLTYMEYERSIERLVVQFKRFLSPDIVGRSASYYSMSVSGVEHSNFMETGWKRVRAYQDGMSLTCIIEYKLLDSIDAPLIINWHWLAPSLKKRLFKM